MRFFTLFLFFTNFSFADSLAKKPFLIYFYNCSVLENTLRHSGYIFNELENEKKSISECIFEDGFGTCQTMFGKIRLNLNKNTSNELVLSNYPNSFLQINKKNKIAFLQHMIIQDDIINSIFCKGMFSSYEENKDKKVVPISEGLKQIKLLNLKKE